MSNFVGVNDVLGRELGSLRLSLTSRCNLACPYCQPDGQEPKALLDQAQHLALITASCLLGAQTLRLTGGEPLLCDDLEPLLAAVQRRRSQKTNPLSNLHELALTSNGVLLTAARARSLRQAGLDRITISLDGTDGASVAQMSGLRGGSVAGIKVLDRVLDAIQAARQAGFDPERGDLKLNSVIQRGLNEHQLLPLAALARQQGIELRFIEYMDVGNSNGWKPEAVVTAAEMVQQIEDCWPLEFIGRLPGSTAQSWRYRDGGGLVGVVASISQPFCGDCNRLRITADGTAFTCLFGAQGTSLLPWLVPEPNLDGLIQIMQSLWQQRFDRYSEERLKAESVGMVPTLVEKPAMAYLGG
ncbi:MAG: GTP 3',8-cyclase MoaA [Prochlorococcus sp.]|jgi:cyclic pyranopterin phosphate synthase|uniref:Molybdenum cofactor biosynthesis protein n=1 Tax=uncultured Prochlorococcus sp. TaxID=159733 RepID=A0A0A7HML2_9CYAN|nr:molybdenum cofactor biosynthesis protein [uncultured Prochlorococcus sp.]MDP6197212.1 radical SAM protein [Prochlorococcaceae cyanobacterium ETNP18_MAG_17]MDP7327066.1 radical SAM protein [Prochlorococcaceae cyanobacterium ETNP7_MAG_30]